jgi:hypothetical protein
MANDYQQTASEVEKVKITDTIVEELGNEGLKFIWKRDITCEEESTRLQENGKEKGWGLH